MTETAYLIQNKTYLYDDKKNEQRPPSRLEWAEASWLRWPYMFCFGWIIRLLSVGYKQTLTDNDLEDLSYKDKSAIICDSLIMDNIQDSIVKNVSKEFFLAGLLLLPYFITRMAQPLIIRQIFLLLEQPQSSWPIAYLYIFLLFLCSVLPPFCFQQSVFRVNRVGLRIRNALTIVIYKYLLASRTTAFNTMNSAKVINLVAIDAGKFSDSTIYIHYLWEGPLEAIFGFLILCSIIGFLPTLSGYLIFISLVPLQLFFSYKLNNVYSFVAKCTDKRLQVLRELLLGCHIMKMFNWEDPMIKQVQAMRQDESKGISMASHIRAFNMSLFFALLPTITLVTVGSSWLLGHPLTSIDIFTSVAIYGVIRTPVTSFLPIAIEKVIQLRVSLDRILTFTTNLRNQQCQSPSSCSEHSFRLPGTIIFHDASFGWSQNKTTLHSLNLNIEPGSFVSITGSIAAGKSSLFAAILGEMHLLQGNQVNIAANSVSYASQSAWTFPDTIRANILLGRPFNAQRYTTVLHACCLDDDLSMLKPTGDLTMISEKGTNLSGGQRARISLARALYMDADIYLLDDPMASVDRRVAKEIYDRCISRHGLLKDKTRLLITHQLQYTLESDQIIHLVDGRIQSVVSPTASLDNDHIKESIDIKSKDERTEVDDLLDITKSTRDNIKPVIEDEVTAVGHVSWKVWRYLFNDSITKCYKISLLLVLFLMAQIFSDVSNILLSMISKQGSTVSFKKENSILTYIYIGMTIATVIVAMMRSHCFYYVFMKGANALHDSMIDGLARTSLRFHESHPHGRILNRASRDQHVVDELLPTTLFDAIQSLHMTAGSIIVLIFVNAWLSIIILPYLIIALILRSIYARSSHPLKRIESIRRSPIYMHFTTSIDGLMTIRASKAEDHFLQMLFNRIDANTRAYISIISASNFFGLFLDVITNIFCVCTIGLTTSLHHVLNQTFMMLLLTYSITIKGYFQWGLRQAIEAQMLMTSVERIHEYTQLPREENLDDPNKDFIAPPSDWPQQGSIEFSNFQLRYRASLQPALLDINLRIEPNEKIGIIGRTGQTSRHLHN